MATKPVTTTVGPAPSPEALAYFRNKGDQPSFSWKDVTPEEHAFVFTVAKATQVEVLTTIRDAVDEAIEKGVPVEQFKRELTPKLIALGWWGKQKVVDPETGEVVDAQLGSPRRLETIYWANVRTAAAAGAWQRAQRTKSVMPYFLYQLGPSEVHRPEHVAIEGTILPIDDPFWGTHYPPNGWGCKCWVSQISKAEAGTLGYDPEKPAPDLGMTIYVNARTGEMREIPRGIDPGWESNPGALRQTNLRRHLTGALDAAPEPLQRVATKDVIASEQFRRIVSREIEGVAPVGVLPERMRETLGATTRTVLFSDYTAEKGARKHDDVDAQDYLVVQRLIDEGHATRDRDKHVVYTGEIDGKMWKAAVKVTADGREVYLSSLHRLRSAGKADRIRRRGE